MRCPSTLPPVPLAVQCLGTLDRGRYQGLLASVVSKAARTIGAEPTHYALTAWAAPTLSASNTTASACTTEASRIAASTASSLSPFSRTTFSCESTHAEQPLIAETAAHHNSKSAASM